MSRRRVFEVREWFYPDGAPGWSVTILHDLTSYEDAKAYVASVHEEEPWRDLTIAVCQST